jgi:hypothetical protein
VRHPQESGPGLGSLQVELELLPGSDYAPSLLSKLTIELQSQDGVPKKKKRKRR